MKKTLDLCDWCEQKEAVAMINQGNDKGDFLCVDCIDEFLEFLSDEFLSDLEGNGDWRMAKKLQKEKMKSALAKQEGKNGTMEKD